MNHPTPTSPVASEPNAGAAADHTARETRTSPVLVTRGVAAWYGSSLALSDINIEIPRNKITALIGPSGCGKSTLLRCFNRMNDLIAGFRMEGEIRFDDQTISTPDVDAVSLRRRIGMVFQRPEPVPQEHLSERRLGCPDQRLPG